MMLVRVRVNFSALRKVAIHEYVSRFVLGAAITVVAGLIARRFGPVAGGVFLAFPAIFPASATLLEKHQRQKKQRAGIRFTLRGRLAAAIDARGAALGSIALIGFALVCWRALPQHRPVWVMSLALAVWLACAIALWRLRQSHALWCAHRRRTGSP
ncbi:MAG TPA: DUF3147 family protein [Steroidobacteraceae bacterium]|jgi:hypothetical protein